MKNRLPGRILLSVMALLLGLGLLEIGLRIFLGEKLRIQNDERNLMYRYDETLGWFPKAGSKNTFTGSVPIRAEHNQRGFRDIEHTLDDRPRIVFIGDSLLWGYDVEQDERCTDRLREKLPQYAIYNLGVSGYGTDQAYILLGQQFDFYKPDIVFLVFCNYNDEEDNSANMRYNGYYKPYFKKTPEGLKLGGTPVPPSFNYYAARHKGLAHLYLSRFLMKSYVRIKTPGSRYQTFDNPTTAILLEMHQEVKKRGATLVVGLQDKHPELERFFNQEKIAYLNLENSFKFSTHGEHWTAEGHRLVSEIIHDFLIRRHTL